MSWLVSCCPGLEGRLAETGAVGSYHQTGVIYVVAGISSTVSYFLSLGRILAETGVVYLVAGISSTVSYFLGLGGTLAETGVVSVVAGISSMVSYCPGLGGRQAETGVCGSWSFITG